MKAIERAIGNDGQDDEMEVMIEVVGFELRATVPTEDGESYWMFRLDRVESVLKIEDNDRDLRNFIAAHNNPFQFKLTKTLKDSDGIVISTGSVRILKKTGERVRVFNLDYENGLVEAQTIGTQTTIRVLPDDLVSIKQSDRNPTPGTAVPFPSMFRDKNGDPLYMGSIRNFVIRDSENVSHEMKSEVMTYDESTGGVRVIYQLENDYSNPNGRKAYTWINPKELY
jgi:hypothetical protein